MKAIMISIKPEYVAKILNGEKTLEIRKTMPKCELPIEVYIYCTKGKDKFYIKNRTYKIIIAGHKCEVTEEMLINGKVVAKFTLNKVEKLHIKRGVGWETETIKGTQEIEKMSCVNRVIVLF